MPALWALMPSGGMSLAPLLAHEPDAWRSASLDSQPERLADNPRRRLALARAGAVWNNIGLSAFYGGPRAIAGGTVPISHNGPLVRGVTALTSIKSARDEAEGRFKKKEIQLVEAHKAWAEYESKALAVREKTSRLRALRLARESGPAPVEKARAVRSRVQRAVVG